MVHAYVAIIIEEGAAGDDAAAIRDLSGVTEAHVVAGDFELSPRYRTAIPRAPIFTP